MLETTVDDVRRVRQIPDVQHISQRKVGQNGRVRITVDKPESVIPGATSHSCIWSRSSLCANIGLLFYQSVEQWEELSSLLTTEVWFSGRVLWESPRWVLVDTSTGLHSDDVISRLKEWRVAGLISEDISYRSWHVNKEGRINLNVGLIDSGAKAEIRNVDPRFTTGTCKALLSAIGIWVDSKTISIDEVFDSEGIASRAMSVNVFKNDIDRLVSISRSFISNNEKMKVLFTRVDLISAHASAHPSSGSFTSGDALVTTSTSPMSHKRSRKSNVKQPRLIKTKLEDALMSGQHDAVAFTEDPTESDDTFALDCTDSLDFQKPCDPSSSLAPGDIVQAPRLIRGSTTGSEESVQIVQATTSGSIVTRLGFPGAKVRRATRDGAEGWILLNNHYENLYNGPNGLVLDGTVLMQQRRLRNAKQTGISKIPKPSSELLYSLDKARKCGELEAAGLLCGDSSEGRAECVRRQSAANFNGRVQQCDGDGDENNIVESQSTDHPALPPQ